MSTTTAVAVVPAPRIAIVAAQLLNAAIDPYFEAGIEPSLPLKIILRNLYAQLRTGDAGRIYRACPMAIRALALDALSGQNAAVRTAIEVVEAEIDEIRSKETKERLELQWRQRQLRRANAS